MGVVKTLSQAIPPTNVFYSCFSVSLTLKVSDLIVVGRYAQEVQRVGGLS